MVFIPHTSAAISAGDTVELVDSCSNFVGTFTEGHKFIVESVLDHKGTVVFNLVDDEHRRLNDVERKRLKLCK